MLVICIHERVVVEKSAAALGGRQLAPANVSATAARDAAAAAAAASLTTAAAAAAAAVGNGEADEANPEATVPWVPCKRCPVVPAADARKLPLAALTARIR